MRRVLIVDDALIARKLLRTMLEKNGFDVVGEAENGAEGIQKYHEHRPDLVTMDITMPEMDGIQALKAIKAMDPRAKVIVISALGQEVFVKEAVKCGAKNFLLKPFKEDKVIETLNKIAAM
ncbi:response regulator [Candidatus Formimonas warabiya]|uniref:Stage 0 sporulation protein A homolog n=1 Tax=Formimonas warabiya TaxID=1761012 RepID=A0A3G1KUH9_FORW1|nr:response regulator [Candidatus Formimonas warabiya]ATW26102.1 response regulator [Candidatus Formimonas warabiya]